MGTLAKVYGLISLIVTLSTISTLTSDVIYRQAPIESLPIADLDINRGKQDKTYQTFFKAVVEADLHIYEADNIALSYLNNVIQIAPNYARAYFLRGLIQRHLRQS